MKKCNFLQEIVNLTFGLNWMKNFSCFYSFFISWINFKAEDCKSIHHVLGTLTRRDVVKITELMSIAYRTCARSVPPFVVRRIIMIIPKWNSFEVDIWILKLSFIIVNWMWKQSVTWSAPTAAAYYQTVRFRLIVKETNYKDPYSCPTTFIISSFIRREFFLICVAVSSTMVKKNCKIPATRNFFH